MLQIDNTNQQLQSVAAAACATPLAEISLRPLRARPDVPDDTSKFVVFDARDRKLGVVLLSAGVAPNNVRRAMACASRARDFLGHDGLGRVVLEPLAEGVLDERTYAVLPYCQPLSSQRVGGAIQRPFVRRAVLDWLRGVTEQSVATASPEQVEMRFRRPLQELRNFAALPPHLLVVAEQALRRLDSGEWTPRVVFMHGDFWLGNILLDSRRGSSPPLRRWADFVVIDWPGMLLDGYGIFDMVRFGLSTRLRGERLRTELRWHCDVLGCDQVDIASYIAAAHGWTAMQLEYFPIGLFIEMFEDCLGCAP